MSYQGTGRRGPDPKFIMDDEWVEKYLALIVDGAQPYLAAEFLGMNRFILFRYLRWGGYASMEGNKDWTSPDEAVEPYVSFAIKTFMAEAEARMAVTKAVHQKAMADGELGLKYLRARHPESWSPSRIKPAAPAVEVTADEQNGARVVVYMPDNGRRASTGDSSQAKYDPTAHPVIPRPEARSPWPTTRHVEPAPPVQHEGGPEPKLTPYDNDPPKARAWLEDRYPGLGISRSEPDTIFYTRGDYRYSERNPRVFAFMAQFYSWGQDQ